MKLYLFFSLFIITHSVSASTCPKLYCFPKNPENLEVAFYIDIHKSESYQHESLCSAQIRVEKRNLMGFWKPIQKRAVTAHLSGSDSEFEIKFISSLDDIVGNHNKKKHHRPISLNLNIDWQSLIHKAYFGELQYVRYYDFEKYVGNDRYYSSAEYYCIHP